MYWFTQVSLILDARRGSRLLAVLCQQRHGLWLVAAIDTPLSESPSGASFEKSAAAVFDSHSHKVIGTYKDVAEGMRAAEKYARAWMRAKPATASRCSCDEIPVPVSRARRRNRSRA